MNNAMESMLDIYLFEANNLLEQLDEHLLTSEKQGYFDNNAINEIFRVMHTIKGSSAMMQFNSITTISHKIEDLFFLVRESGLKEEYTSPLFDLMFKASDFLKAEIAKVQNNEELLDDVSALQKEINDLIEIISTNKSLPSTEPEKLEIGKDINAQSLIPEDFTDSLISDGYIYPIRVFFDETCQMENLRAFMLINQINEFCTDLRYYPDDVQTNSQTIEYIIQNGFFIAVKSTDDRYLCIKAIEAFVYVKEYSELHTLQDTKAAANTVTDTPTNNQAQNTAKPTTQTNNANNNMSSAHQAPKQQSLINVNLTKLDSLMDLMGEIVITEAMVTAIPSAQGVDMDNFTKASRQLRKLTDELQEVVMSIRMVPVSGVFQKMNRIVRDMSKTLDKDVELVLIGEETEVDKTIVDSISDPLMHLVRNAMDHGIETKEQRAKTDKPQKGTITLSAQNTGGEIVIAVKDDGKGLDPDVILQKAKKNGLLSRPDAEYTQKEIYSFILMPGFSTKEVVTEFSGRGVGMDVVKQNVEKVGGDVSLDSKLGEGSTVLFKIPLTLAIVNGMEISVGNSLFTVPINNIMQSFKATPENILHDTDKREIVMIRNNYYPVVRLHELYSIENATTDIANGILILVETNDKAFCIFADALIGEQQVVVKPLPLYLNKYNIKDYAISGCAILGDGSISLILDAPNLYENI